MTNDEIDEEDKKIAEWQIQKEINELEEKGFFNDPEKYEENVKRIEILLDMEVFELDKKGKLTDIVNCSRLARLLLEKDNNFYLVTRDNLDIYIYNGSYYEPIGEGFIKERVQYYLNDLKNLEHIKKEVVGYIRNNSYIDRDSFNPPLNLINFKNGVYDFDKKVLLEHSPNFHFLYEIPIVYDVTKKCEKWLQFLDDVLYPEDLSFIQEVCGFLLYRKYVWALLLILLGHGRNGKSTFINTMTRILGEKNVTHIPLQVLAYNRFASSKLYSKHANLCADLGTKEVKDTGLLKMLTGQDNIFAEEKMKQGFDFMSFAKLIFACNILPEIKDNTLAMTERLAVLEFPNEFKKDSPECDPDIINKLTTEEELSGIINWMLNGLERLLNNKNFSKYRSFENMAEYKKQTQDPVYQFMMSCLEPNINVNTEKLDVFIEYKKFCELHNYPKLNDVWLGRKLKQFFPTTWNITEGQEGGKTTWKGLEVKSKKKTIQIPKDVDIGDDENIVL